MDDGRWTMDDGRAGCSVRDGDGINPTPMEDGSIDGGRSTYSLSTDGFSIFSNAHGLFFRPQKKRTQLVIATFATVDGGTVPPAGHLGFWVRMWLSFLAGKYLAYSASNAPHKFQIPFLW